MMQRESSEAKSSSAASLPRREETRTWLQRIHEAQIRHMPPEGREELKRKAEQLRRRVQQARKCKAVSNHSKRSHMLVHEGLRQMSSSTPSAVADRWRSAQDASEAQQARKMRRIEASEVAAAATVEEDDSSDEEEAVA